MKYAALAVIGLLQALLSCAQELSIAASYNYIYSKQWDEAVQSYNFSRPFLINKQPLLMHGINLYSGYIWSSSKKIKTGVGFSYKYFRSAAANENFNSTLNLNIINPALLFHYENSQTKSLYFFDVTISVPMGRLSRKINNKLAEDDGTAFKALGIGGDLNFKAGYYVYLKDKRMLSPFLSFGVTPYYYSPDTEAILNQTKGLSGKNWATVFSIQCGISIPVIGLKTE